MGRSRGERSAEWPRNVLRTIAYVAGRGVVGRSELASFQATLPATAWGAMPPQNGWQPVKPVLSWDRAPLAETRALSLKAILGRLLDMAPAWMSREDRDVVEDLRLFVNQEPSPAELEALLSIPRTEVAVRLGLRRSRQALSVYRRALSLCGEAAEQRRFGAMVDLAAAARVLCTAIDAMHPPRLYEAAGDLQRVARAVLARSKSVRLRQERFGVVFEVTSPQRVHRLFLLSRLSQRELADALGVSPRFVRRAMVATGAVDVHPFREAADDLRRAARSK